MTTILPWTLVIFIYNYGAVSVPGFTSEASCLRQAQHIKTVGATHYEFCLQLDFAH